MHSVSLKGSACFLFYFIFLKFIWLGRVLVAALGSPLFCAGSFVVAHKLSSCCSWVLEHVGSVVVVAGLAVPRYAES